MKIGNLSCGFVLRELQGCKWYDQQGLRSNWRISFGYSVVSLHQNYTTCQTPQIILLLRNKHSRIFLHS